jgi:hypothetical protein
MQETSFSCRREPFRYTNDVSSHAVNWQYSWIGFYHAKKMYKEFSKLIAYCTLEILRMMETARRSFPDVSGQMGRRFSGNPLSLN